MSCEMKNCMFVRNSFGQFYFANGASSVHISLIQMRQHFHWRKKYYG